MKTKIWFLLNGVEDFVVVDGQLTKEWALKGEIPSGAEFLDSESFPDVVDPQFGL